MFPVILRIGNIEVFAYGVMLALAFAVGAFGLSREAGKIGFSEDRILEMAIWIMVTALVGARILYVLIELPFYMANPLLVFAVRSGGLSFHGGLVGGILAGLVYTRRYKLPQGIIADMTSPYLALGYAIVRIGCLLNGCCFGRPADVPWALPGAYLDGTLRHPTQLYASMAALLIFVYLLYRKNIIRFHGQLFLEFIVSYSIYRFIVEFYRNAAMAGGFLTLGQAASIVAAAGAYTAIRLWPLGRRAKI